jgi:hypothetical protein
LWILTLSPSAACDIPSRTIRLGGLFQWQFHMSAPTISTTPAVTLAVTNHSPKVNSPRGMVLRRPIIAAYGASLDELIARGFVLPFDRTGLLSQAADNFKNAP